MTNTLKNSALGGAAVAGAVAVALALGLIDLPGGCAKTIHVPDEDEAAKAWMNTIAGIGPDEEVPQDQANAYADILATRLEVSCKAAS